MRKIFSAGLWHVITRVFARHLIAGYAFPDGRRYEDMAFTPYAYMCAKKIMRLNRTRYFYRSHTESITQNLWRSDLDDIEFNIQQTIHYAQQCACAEERNIIIPLILVNGVKLIKQMHKKIYSYYNYNDSIIITLQPASPFISCRDISIKNKLHISNPLIWKNFSME